MPPPCLSEWVKVWGGLCDGGTGQPYYKGSGKDQRQEHSLQRYACRLPGFGSIGVLVLVAAMEGPFRVVIELSAAD